MNLGLAADTAGNVYVATYIQMTPSSTWSTASPWTGPETSFFADTF